MNKGHSSALQNHSIPKGRRANKYWIDNDKILLIMIVSEYEVCKINFQTLLDESAKSSNISNLTIIQSNYEHILSNFRSNCSWNSFHYWNELPFIFILVCNEKVFNFACYILKIVLARSLLLLISWSGRTASGRGEELIVTFRIWPLSKVYLILSFQSIQIALSPKGLGRFFWLLKNSLL